MNDSTQVQADYVVVGAGSGGCAVAGRLADAGYRVIVLEAGPARGGLNARIPAAWPKLFRSRRDWNYQTVPQPALDGRRIYWPRGRMVGGSSAMNAQIYIRGAAHDFDGWAAAGNEGWDYASVLATFKAAENNARGASRFHGTAGPLRVSDPVDPSPLSNAFLAACKNIGIAANTDFNGASMEGAGLAQLTQHRAARWSSADAYLHGNEQLQVVSDAHATSLLFSGTRVTGVAFEHHGRRAQAIAGREVILAGGAINTPQLLLLSGIGPSSALRRVDIDVRHELPGVGANLHDHPITPVWASINTPTSLLAAESPRQLLRYLFARRGMLSSNLAEAAAFLRSHEALNAPDLEIMFVPVLFVDEGLRKPTRHGITLGVSVVTPESRGHVRLASADPLAPPLIDPAYLSTARDWEAMRRGYAMAHRLLTAPALARHVHERLCPDAPDRSGVDAYIRATTQTFYHPAGTCRMGRDAMAVVNPDLTVRGLEGLRIADASIMPRLVRGHPHAATVLIGERAASFALQSAQGQARAA